MLGVFVTTERRVWLDARAAAIDARVAPGACVVTDDSSLTIVSSRFLSTVPGCTKMVDATATDMTLGNGHMALTGAGRYPAVQSAWLEALHHAQYVSLSYGLPVRAAVSRPATAASRGRRRS